MIQVIALTGALTHTGKYAIATMRLGDVINQFLDDNGFTHPCTPEGADLSTFHEGAYQVDNLQASLKDFDRRGLLFQVGCMPVNRQTGSIWHIWFVVDSLTEDVEDTPKGFWTDGYRNRSTGIISGYTTLQTVRWSHRYATHPV